MHAHPVWQIDLLLAYIREDDSAYEITIVIAIDLELLTNKQQKSHEPKENRSLGMQVSRRTKKIRVNIWWNITSMLEDK